MAYPVNEALHQLIHAYKRRLRTATQAQKIDLPVNHLRVLKGVCKCPQSTARTISQRMNQDKAQVTRVLNELTQSGLIEKAENPNDRRSQFLIPTVAGQRTLEKVNALESEVAGEMTHNLSDQELKVFTHIANVMIQNLAEDSAKD
ncbi:MarR family winged helix-turn-helix transcriptional regulator [uncultured Microbulbifer sp.]|uniref:MarR family winged helix-turn-helix transcriptional regulator n=1 Tax=uncultured Microbulbifer sp. TaxID=348147 RepID=UPI0026103D4F|nr:MarR family winged helix-turn-helix transcriptional regulator [uncultured Microbulbifer sp.]